MTAGVLTAEEAARIINDEAAALLGDLVPGCAVGHPGEMGEGSVDPCEQPADYSSDYHACRPEALGSGPGHIVWCAGHHDRYTQKVREHIEQTKAAGRHLIPCEGCRLPISGVKDLIWNTRPIK